MRVLALVVALRLIAACASPVAQSSTGPRTPATPSASPRVAAPTRTGSPPAATATGASASNAVASAPARLEVKVEVVRTPGTVGAWADRTLRSGESASVVLDVTARGS